MCARVLGLREQQLLFDAYIEIIGGTLPAERQWGTGLTVREQLNSIQGVESSRFGTAISTREGMQLFNDLSKELTKASRRPCSMKQIATLWNAKVDTMLQQATTKDEKAQIKAKYNLLDQNLAADHNDKVLTRMAQDAIALGISQHLHKLNAMKKKLRRKVTFVSKEANQTNTPRKLATVRSGTLQTGDKGACALRARSFSLACA